MKSKKYFLPCIFDEPTLFDKIINIASGYLPVILFAVAVYYLIRRQNKKAIIYIVIGILSFFILRAIMFFKAQLLC